jgi:hypothetical protein
MAGLAAEEEVGIETAPADHPHMGGWDTLNAAVQ